MYSGHRGFSGAARTWGWTKVLTAPGSPRETAVAERGIGSLRRACPDQVLVVRAGHRRRLLARYFHYSHLWGTHRSLVMVCPDAHRVQPPEQGAVVAFRDVGGLHHPDERAAV